MVYYEVPPIGYAGIVFISSVAAALSIMAATLSLVIAAFLYVRRKPPRPLAPALSILSIAVALVYAWAMSA